MINAQQTSDDDSSLVQNIIDTRLKFEEERIKAEKKWAAHQNLAK